MVTSAAIGQNELTYKVTLPENFEYVDNSTEVSFVNGMCLILQIRFQLISIDKIIL